MKMVMMILVGVILFGISAGGSWYLNQVAKVDLEAEVELESTVDEDPLKSELPPDPELVEKVDEMPVIQYDDSPISIEQVLKMSETIQAMESKLKDREKVIVKEEQRVQLLFDDLDREKKELVAMGEGITEQIEALDQRTTLLKETLDLLDQRKTELEKLEKSAGVDEASQDNALVERVEQIKDWFSGLDPAQAADYIKGFANNGELSFASALIQKMETRQKTKVLEAIGDPGLVRDLINSLKIQPKNEKE